MKINMTKKTRLILILSAAFVIIAAVCTGIIVKEYNQFKQDTFTFEEISTPYKSNTSFLTADGKDYDAPGHYFSIEFDEEQFHFRAYCQKSFGLIKTNLYYLDYSNSFNEFEDDFLQMFFFGKKGNESKDYQKCISVFYGTNKVEARYLSVVLEYENDGQVEKEYTLDTDAPFICFSPEYNLNNEEHVKSVKLLDSERNVISEKSYE